jgi:hypothetical protein
MSEITIKKITKPEKDSINISSSRITLVVTAINFFDKDTKSNIVYFPSLEMSAYGETKAEASEMAKVSLNEFCHSLASIPTVQQKIELEKLGWKKSLFYNHRFSSAFVDANGVLRGFNVDEDSLQIQQLKILEEVA